MKKVDLGQKVVSKNEEIARVNRVEFTRRGSLVLNFVSSPGSGKTSIIEETVKALKGDYAIFVLTGDLMTENDARRVARHGVEAVQITTGEACHLDARMVGEKMLLASRGTYDLVIIENVGNLVCPATFDLGEDMKVLLVSVAEGDDKPVKYPPMVRASKVLIINKIDLVPYTDSDPEVIQRNALNINPELVVFKMSCRNGEGVPQWIEWLRCRLETKRQTRQRG